MFVLMSKLSRLAHVRVWGKKERVVLLFESNAYGFHNVPILKTCERGLTERLSIIISF